jgi:FKBP-type peptidyl-prolyl cis-trans isomerase
MINFTSKSTKKAIFIPILAIFSIISIFITSLSSCNKTSSCDQKAVYVNDRNAAQNTAMVAFCVAQNITYTTDSSGILYQIITPGGSNRPNLCETISMTYTGTLLNGKQFDAGTISYPLSQLIVGWQIAVPKIGKGGHIKVVIPSSLAYGSQAIPSSAGSPGIPANSPLYFDITLN